FSQRTRLGVRDFREIDRGTSAGRDAVELLTDVRSNAQTKAVELVLFLHAVVRHRDLRRRPRVDRQIRERIAVKRSEKQIANAYEELDGLDVRIAFGRRRVFLFLDEKRTDEAPPEVSQREALRLEVSLRFGRPNDEVDQRLVRTPPIDRQCRDA